jgi:hypothetical protein
MSLERKEILYFCLSIDIRLWNKDDEIIVNESVVSCHCQLLVDIEHNECDDIRDTVKIFWQVISSRFLVSMIMYIQRLFFFFHRHIVNNSSTNIRQRKVHWNEKIHFLRNSRIVTVIEAWASSVEYNRLIHLDHQHDMFSCFIQRIRFITIDLWF